MSDPQPTSSPDQSQMMQLMQQMIELQRENNELRRNMSGASNFSSNAKKPDRPIIEQDSTDNDWALFTDSWQRYKDMCRLRDISEIRNELRSSCSSDVNKLLFDLIGSDRLNSASEAELLMFIKSVAVKGMHKEVHRQTFHSMRQSEGESITHFLARLKSQANFCSFQVQCPNTTDCNQKVSYSEDMISSQMIAGLVNNEHQTRVLAQAAVLVTLQQKFDLLVSLETTDKSTSKLQPPPVAPPAPPSQSNPQKSDYQRKKALPKAEIRPCTGCGKTSHPGKTLRRKDCPAFENTCKICSKKGHFDDVCRKRAESDSAPSSSQLSMQAADIKPTSSIFLKLVYHCPSAQH